MRTEGATYKTNRQAWVTQPALFIRPYFVRKAGDLTEYPFIRDFSSHAVVNASTSKLQCIAEGGVRGNAQSADPVAGRSSIGSLEIDLVDVGGEILKQIADPARPLRLPIRGTATIRNSNLVGAFPMARTLYGSTWTQSGLASFTAALVNDDDTETNSAFHADSAAAGSLLQLDLGVGVTKNFTSVVVYSGGTGANCTWAVECSDDGATWTTLATGFSTGAAKVQGLNFPYFGAHRYWRLRKTNAATGGPFYYEVQWSELASGRNLVLQVDDIRGYPNAGHATLDDEDFAYPSVDLVLNVFNSPTRTARDTLAGDHSADALVRNGEQLRRGTRVTLFLGYQPMNEAEYGPGPGYTKMEIQSLNSLSFGLGWRLTCADIQRFTKRKIFELATQQNPASLGPGHPITLGLQVLMSTGNGSNGSYDVLTRENGAAVPQALIDINAWEQLRGMEGISGVTFQFIEIAPDDAKTWFETQILRPLMIVPYVNQAGQYSGRRVTSPLTLRSAFWSGVFRSAA